MLAPSLGFWPLTDRLTEGITGELIFGVDVIVNVGVMVAVEVRVKVSVAVPV